MEEDTAAAPGVIRVDVEPWNQENPLVRLLGAVMEWGDQYGWFAIFFCAPWLVAIVAALWGG